MGNSLEKNKEIKILILQIKSFCEVIQGILDGTNAIESGRYASFKDFAITYNDFAREARKLLGGLHSIKTFNIDVIPSWQDSLWPTQKRIMEQTLLDAKLLLSILEGSVDFVDDECNNIVDFLNAHVREVIFQKPEREKEVQNAIETLLLGRGLVKGIDFNRESGKILFSGKEYIPDFNLPKMGLCIEVKLLREGQKSRIIEEISADITAYSKEYDRQLYIVYDLGEIQNEVEFKNDIEKVDGVKMIVIKH